MHTTDCILLPAHSLGFHGEYSNLKAFVNTGAALVKQPLISFGQKNQHVTLTKIKGNQNVKGKRW